MNFRFLFYVLLMSASFMLLNYFSSPAKKTPPPQESSQSSELPPLQLETLSPQSLPLVPLYTSVDSTEPVATSFMVSPGHYLAFPWQHNQPPTLLYARKTDGTLEEISRIVDAKTKDSLLFYSSRSHPKLDVVSLPTIKALPVQLLSFPTPNEPRVNAAEYNDGRLMFPAQSPTTPAIVLFKVSGTYLPAGLYQSENSAFIPFDQLTEYGPLTRYTQYETRETQLAKEAFYVLENATMQVVFSTVGGAIAEVNLPFRSAHFPQAVVLPIQFDRIIKKSYPKNALFPLFPYWTIDQTTNKPVQKQPTAGDYYPLLRRGIAQTATSPGYRAPPKSYAFATLSDDFDTAHATYRVRRFTRQSIEFELSLPNRRIVKTYRLPSQEAPYSLLASIQVEGDARGLWISSGVPEVELISGSPAPALRYSRVQGGRLGVHKASLPKIANSLGGFQPNWVANSNGYFSLIFDPLTEIGTATETTLVPGDSDPTRLSMIDPESPPYPANKYPGYQFLLPLINTNAPTHFRLFLGPLDNATLKKVDAIYTDPVTGYTPNYSGAKSFHGWFSFISEPFAKFLFVIMDFFHRLTHSWGFSIILLTLFLRLMMYPLNAWSIKSTLKLQEVGPEMQKLQAKYKNDPKRAQLEMMQFYREHKINPFGGCLPLIIQMPFLFGMFDLLKSTFSLRGASFIPGWIDNLTAPDHLFSWATPLPFIGNSFHLLPIILGVVMFFQQKFNAAQSKKQGPALTAQQQQQQKMGTIMTIAFTVLFYKFPSGLNLYWLSSMVLQIIQQWYMMKRRQKKGLNSPKKVSKSRA